MTTASNLSERRARVCVMQRAGMTNREMAAALGVKVSAIWRDTHAIGSPTPNYRIRPAEFWAWVEALLDDGCSASEAARTVGCTPQAVLAHFPGRGWTPAQSNAHRRVVVGRRWEASNA